MPAPEKILAIKFKFLGDVVIGIPAFRALHERWPNAQLHLLVTADAAPVVEHLPWIHKVWAYPRKRGQSGIGKTWPMLRALRAERFDRSVDFVGGDRTALLSRFIGAGKRLGVVA